MTSKYRVNSLDKNILWNAKREKICNVQKQMVYEIFKDWVFRYQSITRIYFIIKFVSKYIDLYFNCTSFDWIDLKLIHCTYVLNRKIQSIFIYYRGLLWYPPFSHELYMGKRTYVVFSNIDIQIPFLFLFFFF